MSRKRHSCGLEFDYMQNLPLPVLPIQDVFYFHQLWIYALCVHNMKTGKATFYSYHEGQALKGPNEVVSCLNDYIHVNISEEITDLHLFCNGCPGQNKKQCHDQVSNGIISHSKYKNCPLFSSKRSLF